ncbi:hypothetical protein ACM46_22630 [Chryseobacterium angstadtii]|uniref:DUF3592 domain-containing protein n=1 Tax=Chryseobacterium angstadtii TaxID=558151 RepID=A0A0J7HWK6_9FLAO|nr:hypothetical protein [Chryseobacterium angstadtii]KMQ58497.1 hypothetical protein ACM46_22630 [Chryseobacterium angstadtii]
MLQKNNLTNLYSKNQILIIVLIIAGLFYAFYLYFEYKETVETGVVVEKIVIRQNCHAYKLSSSVTVKDKGKLYWIKLAHNTCTEYPEGSRIKVEYNKKRDLFLYIVKTPNHKGRIYLLMIFLLISVMPWSCWIPKEKKFSSKK